MKVSWWYLCADPVRESFLSSKQTFTLPVVVSYGFPKKTRVTDETDD